MAIATRRWWALGLIALAQFMVIMDTDGYSAAFTGAAIIAAVGAVAAAITLRTATPPVAGSETAEPLAAARS